MAAPVKPTAPEPALRSNPDVFRIRAEASLAYQFDALPAWMEELALHMESERQAAEAAAAASGAAGGFDLSGRSLNLFRVNQSATATEFVTVAEVLEAYLASTGAGAQPGDVKVVAGATPAGYLPCNGAAISRTTYAALFAAIGTIYGAGNGSTTFNLPPAAGRVVIGSGGGYSAGQLGGAASHTLTEAQMPRHAHAGSTGGESNGHVHWFNVTSGDQDRQHVHYLNLGTGGFSNNHHHGPLNGTDKFLVEGSGDGVSSLRRSDARETSYMRTLSRVSDAYQNHSHAVQGNTQSANTGHLHNVQGNTADRNQGHTHAFSTDLRGSSQPHNNMQPYIVMNVVIKY